jgi:hypothetical protein
MRLPHRALLGALAIALALATGCVADDNQDGAESASTVPADIDAKMDSLMAQALEEYGAEEWWPHITQWRYTTSLGAPTLAIVTDLDTTTPEQQELVFAIPDAVAALEPEFAYNIDVYSTYEGLSGPEHVRVAWATWGGTPMSQAYDLPETPTGDIQMEVWMEGVFGPGGLIELGPGETWYDSIEGYSWEDPDGAGEDILLVHTSMTRDDINGDDLQFQTLNRAIYTSGSPLLREWQVLGEGDEWLLTLYGEGGPPGQDGPNY